MSKLRTIKTPLLEQRIAAFVRSIMQQGVTVSGAIMFSQCMHENAAVAADIDVAIISPEFGKDRLKELAFLREIALRVDPRIEPVPLSPRALQDNASTLVQKIKKHGIALNLESV